MKNLLQICLVLLLLPLGATAADEAKPYYRQPAISADGSTIAFVYAGDIYLAPASGGDSKLLISHEAYDSNPSFSPDGRFLAFSSRRTGNGDVYIIDLDGGRLHRLSYSSSVDQAEAWSPDSKWVYFSSNRHDIGGSADIYTRRQNAGVQRQRRRASVVAAGTGNQRRDRDLAQEQRPVSH